MSGKIAANSGFVTKVEFTRLQVKVESVLSKIGELSREVKAAQQPAIPPSVASNRKPAGGVRSWLYSKAGSRKPRDHVSSSIDSTSCQNCGNETPPTHPPRHLTGSDAGKHIYLQQIKEEGPDENRRLRNELNQFQTEVKNEIRSLQNSVKDLQNLYKSLDKLVNDSIVSLQRTIDRIQERSGTNAERSDQQSFVSKTRSAAVSRDDRTNGKVAHAELVDDRGGYPKLRKHSTIM